MAAADSEKTYIVPLPDRGMDEIAGLLAPYLDGACVAVGPGWALFLDAAKADAFADSLNTPARQPETV